MGIIQTLIENQLQLQFKPSHLQVINESSNHSVPPGSESHFKLIVVSDHFEGKRPVQRHQAVYAVLTDALARGVHALAIHTYTQNEWQSTQVPDSPACLGGSKQDKK